VKSARRLAASALGVYAGLLGAQHGAFEILQGPGRPDDLIIRAIGAPCQPQTVWHACLPAMTVIPSFRVTGILALTVGLLTIIWSAAFVQCRHGGPMLILLAIALLLVGGGFVAPFIGIIAGVAGATIGAPLRWWQTRVPGSALHLLAALWPGTLVILLVWLPGAWILGRLAAPAMLRLSGFLFFVFDLGLPLLTPLAALAHDARTHGAAKPMWEEGLP
jgi:hypothetical protein